MKENFHMKNKLACLQSTLIFKNKTRAFNVYEMKREFFTFKKRNSKLVVAALREHKFNINVRNKRLIQTFWVSCTLGLAQLRFK